MSATIIAVFDSSRNRFITLNGTANDTNIISEIKRRFRQLQYRTNSPSDTYTGSKSFMYTPEMGAAQLFKKLPSTTFPKRDKSIGTALDPHHLLDCTVTLVFTYIYIQYKYIYRYIIYIYIMCIYIYYMYIYLSNFFIFLLFFVCVSVLATVRAL
jgi:hypothetical protein